MEFSSINNPLKDDLDHILAHTEGLWEELRGARIFITGGTGFFGSWLLESFIWANEKLGLNAAATVLTRNPESYKKKTPHLALHPAIKLHIGDVRTFAFPPEKFSHIIHAANEAADYIGASDAPIMVKEAIVKGAKHTLDFAEHCLAGNFLFISSGTVYGPQPTGLPHLPETYEGMRDDSTFRFAHGEGKFIAESLCADYAATQGIHAKIARCFTFLGPYMPLNANYAVGNFIRDGLKGRPIIVQGDGTPYRSYMYAADLMVWLWTILIKGQSLRPYNVGSMEAITIADVGKMVSQHFSDHKPLKILKKGAAGQDDIYVPETTRAQQELMLQQWISLPEAIEKTIKYFQRKRDSNDC